MDAQIRKDIVIADLERAQGAINAALEYIKDHGVGRGRPIDYATRGAVQYAMEDLKRAKRELGKSYEPDN